MDEDLRGLERRASETGAPEDYSHLAGAYGRLGRFLEAAGAYLSAGQSLDASRSLLLCSDAQLRSPLASRAIDQLVLDRASRVQPQVCVVNGEIYANLAEANVRRVEYGIASARIALAFASYQNPPQSLREFAGRLAKIHRGLNNLRGACSVLEELLRRPLQTGSSAAESRVRAYREAGETDEAREVLIDVLVRGEVYDWVRREFAILFPVSIPFGASARYVEDEPIEDPLAIEEAIERDQEERARARMGRDPVFD
ncbi:hypothetical protein HY489_00285 [Candidatus Woesearchaeota archaeon]|nr:hypothetical protein [Candidatus Woesearchaeota archaeon]